jgi:hypothetical protein
MTREDLQFVTIEDFSPGIFTNTGYQGGEGAAGMLGAATEENTYRCIATPAGFLGPAPRRTLDITLPEFTNWADNREYFISGFDALLSYTLVSNPNTADRVEMHFHLEYQNGTQYRSRWNRYRIFDLTTQTIEALHTLDIAAHTGERRAVTFQHTRMNIADPLDFGQIVTVACWAGEPGQALQRWAKAFPDPANANAISTVDVGDPTNHGYTNLVAHQGRVALNRHLTYDRGVDVDLSITDNWYWTQPNTNELSSATPTPFVYENPQGIADLFSCSANELFAIKTIGGGFVVRGSLDNPTVIQLPNLHSPTQGPRGQNFKGCRSSLGIIFCGPDGAYLWEGGDKSRKISPQLEGDFFHTGFTCLQYTGSAARWQDHVVFPMNWMLDTTKGSWWRLDDPDDLTVTWWSESGYRNYLYGMYHHVDNTAGAGDRQIAWRWDYDEPSYSYSWQSQPLPNVENKLMQVREVGITFQGATQDITITVTNEAGTSKSVTFSDMNSPTTWQRVIQPIAIQGRHLTIRIQCDGTAESNPAALIRDPSFGLEYSTHIPNVA